MGVIANKTKGQNPMWYIKHQKGDNGYVDKFETYRTKDGTKMVKVRWVKSGIENQYVRNDLLVIIPINNYTETRK